MDKRIGVLLLAFALINICNCQNPDAQESAQAIREELKKLLGQEARLYETKLRLLQQLNSFQLELNPITTNSTDSAAAATLASVPPTITVTRVVESSEDDELAAASISTFLSKVSTTAATATGSAGIANTTSIIIIATPSPNIFTDSPEIIKEVGVPMSTSTLPTASSSSSTLGSGQNPPDSVSDLVSFSEVRVDSPSIVVLRGRKPAVTRS